MANRRIPIIKNEIYHVYNRGIAKQPIFKSYKNYTRAIEVFKFYQYKSPTLRFSFYNRLPLDQKAQFIQKLEKSTHPQVDIICFCLMPNHFHFLLKNLEDNGINRFISNTQNSYAKYFNILTSRTGSLFEQNFKAVRIESDDQLLHVSRYIHLNPLTSYLVKYSEELENYQWSSYPKYLKKGASYLKKDLVLENFRSIPVYKKFVTDQANYQRELNKIKHLTFELNK